MTILKSPRAKSESGPWGVTSCGFVLSELLLAAAIAAFAFSGLLALHINCMLLNDANRNLSIALTHAQYVMEDMRNTNFSLLKSSIDNGNWDWDNSEIAAEGLDPLSSESVDAQVTGTDLLNVAVVVSWKDRTGRNRQVSLETFFVSL